MKRILIGFVLVGVISFGGYIIWALGFLDNAEEYVKTEIVEKEVIKEVNPLDEKIRQRELELEESYRKMQGLEASIAVKKAERDRIDAEIIAEQKELAGFIQDIASKN